MYKQGYAYISDPETGIRETDTYTCNHCNKVIHAPVNKKIEEVGDFCRNCMRVICAACADKRVCVPFLKVVEQMEDSYHKRRWMEL